MEIERLLLCSQEPATGPYPVPNWAPPHTRFEMGPPLPREEGQKERLPTIHVACVFVTVGTCLPSRCLATMKGGCDTHTVTQTAKLSQKPTSLILTKLKAYEITLLFLTLFVLASVRSVSYQRKVCHCVFFPKPYICDCIMLVVSIYFIRRFVAMLTVNIIFQLLIAMQLISVFI
jgi:hypothetical protein